jgi:hypothetical protein
MCNYLTIYLHINDDLIIGLKKENQPINFYFISQSDKLI